MTAQSSSTAALHVALDWGASCSASASAPTSHTFLPGFIWLSVAGAVKTVARLTGDHLLSIAKRNCIVIIECGSGVARGDEAFCVRSSERRKSKRFPGRRRQVAVTRSRPVSPPPQG